MRPMFLYTGRSFFGAAMRRMLGCCAASCATARAVPSVEALSMRMMLNCFAGCRRRGSGGGAVDEGGGAVVGGDDEGEGGVSGEAGVHKGIIG